ncbi:MAG: hypothetical protein LBC76_08090 [Treponema sp.]|nr:hypothetical protein [Treponema sp.]
MSEQTLKAILNPPFRYDCGTIFDSNNQIFCRIHLLLPGLGELTAAALNEKWERELKEPDENVSCYDCRHYFVDKEDLDRCKLKGKTVTVDPEIEEPCSGFENKKFEPLRWIKSRSLGIDWIDCPVCKHGLQEGTKDFNYCPFCGQRLYPPEEA